MTEKEFIEYLVAKLSVVEDTCAMCVYSPSNGVCLCEEMSVCAEGMRKFAEKREAEL